MNSQKHMMKQIQYVKQAIQNTPGAPFSLMEEAKKVEKKLEQHYLGP